MSKYYLMPVYDSRKSFYNKAVVTVNELDTGIVSLESYGVTVVNVWPSWCSTRIQLLPDWDSSQTTLRHVKEFLKQLGYKADTLNQIRKDYA